MIAIIDYGLGNVKAFANVYHKLNIPARIAKEPKDLKNVTKLILPGVGAFDHAMQMLENSGMRLVLDEMVLQRHLPVLGICVGMHLLACSSEEGRLLGLGWIDSEVKRFKPSAFKHSLRVPHMGWNNIRPVKPNGLLQGFDPDARFYFLHSYYMHCKNNEDVIAVTEYGDVFACAVNHGSILGVQFHPEKSHQWGIQLLRNFAEL